MWGCVGRLQKGREYYCFILLNMLDKYASNVNLHEMWMASTASVTSDGRSIIILFHEGIMKTILYYMSDLIN